MLFPGKVYCFKSSRKLTQHAVSLFQHYWKWRGGAGVTCRTKQSWESMRRRFTINSIFLDIKKIDFYIKKWIPFLDIRTSFFDLKKSISWYQNIDSWYQVIGLIFLSRNRIDFYIMDFFYIKKWIFLYQTSIFDITKYTINSKTAPQRAVLLFIRYFFLFLIWKNINLSFWYKISVRFLIKNSIFWYKKNR